MKDGADYVTKVIKNLGSMKDLILGMHLSCSISGEYRKRAAGNIPAEITPEVISRHIHPSTGMNLSGQKQPHGSWKRPSLPM